jgi:hypothetical protein
MPDLRTVRCASRPPGNVMGMGGIVIRKRGPCGICPDEMAEGVGIQMGRCPRATASRESQRVWRWPGQAGDWPHGADNGRVYHSLRVPLRRPHPLHHRRIVMRLIGPPAIRRGPKNRRDSPKKTTGAKYNRGALKDGTRQLEISHVVCARIRRTHAYVL